METPQQDLQTRGKALTKTFETLVNAPRLPQDDIFVPSRQRIAVEEERLSLWARSLGLFQKGHASLDYRIGDALFIKSLLIDLLEELQEHVQIRE